MNDADISLKYKLKEGVTYKKVCKTMEKMNIDWLNKKDQHIAEL